MLASARAGERAEEGGVLLVGERREVGGRGKLPVGTGCQRLRERGVGVWRSRAGPGERLREKVRAPVGLAGWRAVRGEQAERAVRAGEKVNKAGRRAQGLAGQARWGLGWLKG